MTLFRETLNVSFEAVAVYDDIDCEIAYGTLKVEGITAPALRFCMHKEVRDVAIKLYGEFIAKVESTSYYICIPPYRYVTYSETPDILLFMRPNGYVHMILCRVGAETCKQMRDALWGVNDIKQAYTIVESILVAKQQQKDKPQSYAH
jgi:hypothetical protein